MNSPYRHLANLPPSVWQNMVPQAVTPAAPVYTYADPVPAPPQSQPQYAPQPQPAAPQLTTYAVQPQPAVVPQTVAPMVQTQAPSVQPSAVSDSGFLPPSATAAVNPATNAVQYVPMQQMQSYPLAPIQDNFPSPLTIGLLALAAYYIYTRMNSGKGIF